MLDTVIDAAEQNILYIEDDAALRRMFRVMEASRLKPFRFTFAETLAEGVEELRLNPKKYCAVVSDYHLPDGEAKTIFPLAVDLPVVVLTGTYDVDLAVDLIKSGVDDFLVKDPQLKFLQLLPEKIKTVIEKKESELEAERQKRRFRDLFDNSNDIILYLDQAGIIKQTNPAFQEFLGYDQNPENLGLSLIVDHADRQAFENKVAALLPGQKFDDHEIRMNAKDGRMVVVECSVSIGRAGDDLFHARVILRDVTERKKNEQLIKAQNKDLDAKNKEINRGLIKLRNHTISRRSAVITIIAGLIIYFFSEYWLAPTLVKLTQNTNFTWINKVAILLLLKPMDLFVERWLMRLKMKEAGLG
jgi:PAS domain S-box